MIRISYFQDKFINLLIGKGNIHELGFGVTSNNYHFGPVKNPVNPKLISGGNSGGAAVAVATGIAKIGIGVDTFGSCRIPASLCGTYGFKPTHGRYALNGVVPISHTADSIGIITNRIEDIVVIDSILTTGQDKRRQSSLDSPGIFRVWPEKIRLGVCKNYFYEHLSNDVAFCISGILQKLSNDENIELVCVDTGGIDKCMTTGLDLYHHEISRDLPKFMLDNKTGVSFEKLVDKLASPDVRLKMTKLLECQNEIENDELYMSSLSERSLLIDFYRAIFKDNNIDALIFPTTPIEAKPYEGNVQSVQVDGKIVPTFDIYSQNTFPAAFAGLPSITLPLAKTPQNLPVGITLESDKGNDRYLFEIAAAVRDTILK